MSLDESVCRVERLSVQMTMVNASIRSIARYPSVARELDWFCLGQVRARGKVSCIQFKTRQGSFRSARKEVVLIIV